MTILSPDIRTQPKSTVRRGCLALVVGPSGAGKDSILDGARARLADGANIDVAFARREVTRPADAGGEDHIAVTMADFRQRAVGGDYALAWEAHGHGYGVPSAALGGLGRGQSVVVNVSRGILASARARFQPLCVIRISVPRQILAQRLQGRGRENADEIARRLDRADAFQVEGDDVFTVVNDGPLDEAVDAFVDILRAVSPSKG
jgi:ribose 1,5-bisphosphokinase